MSPQSTAHVPEQPALQQLSRSDLTRLACDTLAAEGKKPSIGLVRAWTIAATGARKGSDGDVQKDIHDWFADLLKLKRDKAMAGLPDAVGALARDFWRLAVDAADGALAGAHATLAAEQAEAGKLIDLAQEDTVAALAIANELKNRLALAAETLTGRDDAIARLEQTQAEIRATVQAKDERIAGLSAELARKSADYAAGLAELDGLRRHSLLQIDQARAEARLWKAEFERVDGENKSTVVQYRQKAAILDNALAAARGRLGAVEEALAAAQQRCRNLEASLAAANATSAATGTAGLRRFGAGKLRAVVRRKKL
ncbi:MAG: DNA-binding protein [Burkholderiaceae bacterium]